MADSGDGSSKLFRIRKTVYKMLTDRNYVVSEEDETQTKEQARNCFINASIIVCFCFLVEDLIYSSSFQPFSVHVSITVQRKIRGESKPVGFANSSRAAKRHDRSGAPSRRFYFI